ncbi:MAG: LUD domain-containing protein [Vicinamibacteria bacterium]|nr:LUD domain-containing protein [Vicinamibacteria bacterium]
MSESVNPFIDAVRRALGRDARSPLAIRPPIVAPRTAGDHAAEMDRLLTEIDALCGVAERLDAYAIGGALKRLVAEQGVRRASLWPTPRLQALRIEDRLRQHGVEIVSPRADKNDLAGCDLGVTEVDFALPETGTLCLLSSPDKPRAVSLLPRIHLAILDGGALRADLHQVFAEAKNHSCLILISGPSRTADIELTVTLGVHGPSALHVWALS